MRKYYIDNLRTFCILLLFPYHTAMIYNNWGEAFYVTAKPEHIPSLFCVIVYPWWMNLLFVLAGISSYYALKSKSLQEYLKERIHKLLVPFLAGLLLLIPVQSYIADIYHNQYSGSYLEHLRIFFTRFTDLTGGDGGFTPGHLWFILYLYVISLIMLPLMKRYTKSKQIAYEKINIVMLIMLFVIVMICTPILQIGKSIGEAFACFALGYYILSNDSIQDRLETNRWLLGSLFLILLATRVWFWNHDMGSGIIWDIEYVIYSWVGILFLLGFTKRLWNKTNKVCKYFSKASFSLYYLHQSILIIVAYFVVRRVDSTWVQFLLIMTVSFGFSLGCYELYRRFKSEGINARN